MKKMMIFAVLVIVSMTAFAQVSKEEQELIDLSNQKWVWMAEKNADRLAELFLDNAQFVHMGGGWGKQQEVDIIRGGMIWYKHADIHSQEVKFTDKNVGTVYSNIHLTSEVVPVHGERGVYPSAEGLGTVGTHLHEVGRTRPAIRACTDFGREYKDATVRHRHLSDD